MGRLCATATPAARAPMQASVLRAPCSPHAMMSISTSMVRSPLVEGSSALQCHPVIGFTLVFHNIVCVSVGYGELLPAVDLSQALKEDFLSSVERRMHCMSAEQRFLCCSSPLLSG